MIALMMCVLAALSLNPLRGMDMDTALDVARNDEINAIRWHLGNNNDFEARDRHGQTLLHGAAQGNALRVVSLLLDKGAPVDAKNPGGATPLYYAARRGNIEVMNILLDHGASVGGVSVFFHAEPLHGAAIGAKARAAQLLLDREADINARDHNEDTPLHLVIASENENEDEIFKTALLLLQKNATSVNAQNKDGRTPLHKAAARGRYKLSLLLLEHGADVLAEDTLSGTPYHAACRQDTTNYRNTAMAILWYAKRQNKLRALLDHELTPQTDFVMSEEQCDEKLLKFFDGQLHNHIVKELEQ